MKRKYFLLWALILLTISMLNIGYSALGTNLQISDVVATIRPKVDIRITGFTYSENSNGGLSSIEDYSSHSVLSNPTLPNENSTITYKIDITNYGNMEMGIYSATISEELEEILDVSFQGYTIGTKLKDNSNSCEDTTSGCKLGITSTFYITIKYKTGKYNNDKTNFDFRINFEYKPIYTIIINSNPHQVNLNYTINGIVQEPVISPLKIVGFEGTEIKITASKSGYKSKDFTFIIVEDESPKTYEIKLSPLYYVHIWTNPSTTFVYKINGISQTSVTAIDGYYEEDTEIEIPEIQKVGYQTIKNRKYTITKNIEEEIKLTPVYTIRIETEPTSATLNYKINGIPQSATTSPLEITDVVGTEIKVTASKAGYQTSSEQTYTISASSSTSNPYKIKLLPLYTYTARISSNLSIPDISTLNSTITLTSNGKTIKQCTNTTTCQVTNQPEGTEITATITADYHNNATQTTKVTSNSTTTINLTHKTATRYINPAQSITFGPSTCVITDTNTVLGPLNDPNPADCNIALYDGNITWFYTSLNNLLNDDIVTGITGRVMMGLISGKTTTGNVSILRGGTQCSSLNISSVTTTDQTHTANICTVNNVLGSTIRSEGIRLSATIHETDGWIPRARWYGSDLTINVIPK